MTRKDWLVQNYLAWGMTQAEIAEFLGASPATIYRARQRIRHQGKCEGFPVILTDNHSDKGDVKSPATAMPQVEPLVAAIKAVFVSQYPDEKPDWNWPAQMSHVKRLAARARKQPDPEEHIKRVLETFAWLLMRSQDRFWRTQPFTPMTLDSEAIYTRVCKYMEGEKSVVDEALRSMTK